ncbi:type I-E CRISPR-associated protein Cas6/Cse3/CasE [Lactiplantibacillus carotarum]|uniref:type I-E CRISPR-associated protein Cas6/Cse3/CasE n=1 Tax=Lactiplantibacillus carotarum TaxID=2993456 RepID=UPI00298F34AD|nr:type I-E CRISPR-associated protein Cas6/Cse3/CasE [Lactiplantibacillus carotarum]
MYLSRVEIDTNNRVKTKDLTHLGAYHNWVEQSFPADLKNEGHSRHLWRIDNLAGRRYLLILSASLPDSTALSKYGVPGTIQTKSYDKFLGHLREGQTMRFRLTANPSYTAVTPGAKQGRIYPHITVEQQRKWLIDRAEKAGFKLIETDPASNEPSLTFDIVNRDWAMLQRRRSRGGRGVRLSRVTFEGLLRITDLEAFKRLLTEGIGREKAFGMGLMTVIPED